jgi:bifunctional DNase/RNase
MGIFFSLPSGREQLARVTAVGWRSAGAAALLAGVPGSGTMVELTVQDVIPIADAKAHAVVLTSSDEQVLLPIFVTEEAAVSIAFRLAHQDSPHPLAADLLDDVVSIMGGQVTEVRIDDVRDDIYTSHVVIRQGETDHKLSARPSDAIAMALTGKAKIFCAQQVLAQAGISRREIDALREQMGVGGGPPPGGPPARPEKTPGVKKAPPRDDSHIQL